MCIGRWNCSPRLREGNALPAQPSVMMKQKEYTRAPLRVGKPAAAPSWTRLGREACGTLIWFAESKECVTQIMHSSGEMLCQTPGALDGANGAPEWSKRHVLEPIGGFHFPITTFSILRPLSTGCAHFSSLKLQLKSQNNPRSQHPTSPPYPQFLLTTLLSFPAVMSPATGNIPNHAPSLTPIPRPLRPGVRQTHPSYPVPVIRLIGETFFPGITK